MSYTQIKLEMHRKQNNVGSCLTVTTRPNLTPERTPTGDPGFAFSSLGVCFGFAFQKSASTLGLLWVCLGWVRSASALQGLLNALRREGDPALLLLSGSPTPCIFQIHFLTWVRKISFLLAIGSTHCESCC